MGIESQYLGEINIPEEHRAEYAQQALKLLRAGGMVTVEPVQLITVDGRALRRTLVNGRCKRSGHSYSHSAGTKPTKPTLFADAHSSMSYALANSTGSREPSDRRYTSGQGLISVWLSPR